MSDKNMEKEILVESLEIYKPNSVTRESYKILDQTF